MQATEKFYNKPGYLSVVRKIDQVRRVREQKNLALDCAKCNVRDPARRVATKSNASCAPPSRDLCERYPRIPLTWNAAANLRTRLPYSAQRLRRILEPAKKGPKIWDKIHETVRRQLDARSMVRANHFRSKDQNVMPNYIHAHRKNRDTAVLKSTEKARYRFQAIEHFDPEVMRAGFFEKVSHPVDYGPRQLGIEYAKKARPSLMGSRCLFEVW